MWSIIISGWCKTFTLVRAEAITGDDLHSQTGRHTTWWREGGLYDTQGHTRKWRTCNTVSLLCFVVASQQFECRKARFQVFTSASHNPPFSYLASLTACRSQHMLTRPALFLLEESLLWAWTWAQVRHPLRLTVSCARCLLLNDIAFSLFMAHQ